jgi:hypothetical protein
MTNDLLPQITALDLGADSYVLNYRTDGDIFAEDRHGEQTSGQSSTAAVAVFFDIDGQLDYVFADLYQQGDVETLDRAIETLSKIRDALAGMYENLPRRVGRCYAQGFGGQCTRQADHAPGGHDFPLSDEARAAFAPEQVLAYTTQPSEGSWAR